MKGVTGNYHDTDIDTMGDKHDAITSMEWHIILGRGDDTVVIKPGTSLSQVLHSPQTVFTANISAVIFKTLLLITYSIKNFTILAFLYESFEVFNVINL